MKPSFSCAVVLCLYPTFTAPVLAQDFLDKIRPVVEFENISLANGSIQHSIAIETKPGLLYTFQSSDDLVSWNDDAVYYSLGQKLTHALRESTPPPPPDPEAPPAPAYPSAFATLLVQPSSGTSGGTVVSWRSLDDSRPMTYHIAGNMDPAWQLVPMIVCDYDNHQFFFSHPPSSVAPPTENPTLGEKDATMIAVLEDRLDEINQSLINSAYHTQHLPAPAPTAGQRRFLRVKATAVDTDGDNVTDFDEFLLAAENNPLGNAFNSDADGNGALDDTQVDTDMDGQTNATDATPSDGTAAYTTVPYVRYAFFEIPGGAGQINDQGIALYFDKTWQGGTLVDLQGINRDDRREHANGINDSGLIIGQAVVMVPGAGTDTVACAWTNRNAGRSVFGNLSENGQTFPTSYNEEGVYFTNSFLGPDGRFAGLRNDYESGPVISSHHIWELAGDPPQLSSVAAPESIVSGQPNVQHMISGFGTNGIMWGAKARSNSNGIVFAPNELPELPFVPKSVIRHDLPNGQTAIFALPYSGNACVYLNGSWKDSPAYANATDIAGDGIAIGMNIPAIGAEGSHNFQAAKVAPIFLNGKWTSIERTAPDLPVAWKDEATQLMDISQGGWILANRANPTTNAQQSAVMLPLRIEGVPPDQSAPESTGVDGVSVGADNPELNMDNDPTFKPVKERLWIMAPTGSGVTSARIIAPLNENTPLKISAPGIKFNGQDEIYLSDTEQVITINATNQAAPGQDIPVQLSFGEVTSLSQPVGIKIMKKRVVKATLHPIASLSYPREAGSNHPDLQAEMRAYKPRGTPTKAELEAFLKKVFKPQLNATFEVSIRDEVELEWDTAGPQDYNLPSSNNSIFPHDNWLPMPLQPGPEESFIHNALKDASADLNIYYINTGASGGILLGGVNGVARDGAARPEGNYVFIDSISFMTSGPELENLHRLHTIAHEIGHCVLGPGHPHQEDRYGMAPLKGLMPESSVSERLMATGAALRRSNPGFRIVKGEWDMAEKWFKLRPLGDN